MTKEIFWIIEEGPLPSRDYYILPFLHSVKLKNPSIEYKLLKKPVPLEYDEVSLIFVRYLSPEWRAFVEKQQKRIKRIYYFMDDDLFDVKAWKGLPLRYRLRLFRKAYVWKEWLKKRGALFFVSTNFLAEKYQDLKAITLPPFPIFELNQPSEEAPSSLKTSPPRERIRLFYFATSSHKGEFKWLYSIIREVLKGSSKIYVELIGDPYVYKLYKNLERIILLYPLSWESYKSYLTGTVRDVGLAPLLGNPFNWARGITKFYEITASSAVGIYSENSPYSEVIKPGEEGYILTNSVKDWVEAILYLSENQAEREKILERARKKILQIREELTETYQGIWRRCL